MALKLYYDYKLDCLAKQFADTVYNCPVQDVSAAALLQSHTVVVQTRGMAEFLRQYLAESCDVAANLDMPFLNSFINRTLLQLYGNDFKSAALHSDTEHMRYRIMQILCDEEYVRNALPDLAGYITGGNAKLKRWQLAGAIAEVFDHYQLYRSSDKLAEMFNSGGSENNWQKTLYTQLFNDVTPGRDHFFRRFAAEEFTLEQMQRIPKELSVFGVGTMPPEYLNFFVRLSHYCSVNFFYLTPCMEYWENQKARREVKKPAAWEIAEAGNPLLQELGRQGRSFFSCMMNHEDISSQMEPAFADGPDDYPANSSMLEIMQYDIRYLFDRRKIADDEEYSVQQTVGTPRYDQKDDRSIAIHNCHSIRRELEVLHDELLKLIRQGIDPSNIIVMAPDITACAPIIHSVFGNGELANVYSIADMQQPEHALAWVSFKSILNSANSRFEYNSVMSLLDMPLINSVLGFSGNELAKYGEFIYQAGARWGFNENMREKFCGRRFEEFSWQQAIDRLLAGFANRSINGSTTAIAGNAKVINALETPDIENFARLIRLLEKLAELAQIIAEEKSIISWCNVFDDIMNNFFADGNDERTALAPLRQAVRKLRNAAFNGFIKGEYPLNAALQMLDDHITSSGETGRFLRGKITFCRMTPMRSIPMDVVAILELNEGVFPRTQTPPGFDLLPRLPLPGDRSLTAQDRYLLLEALMAPRKNLLLFYQGQDPRNGDEIPPCVPLGEIMEYLHNAFGLKAYKHKVSGISEVYFTAGVKYKSLNKENYKALKHLQEYLQASFENPDIPLAPQSSNTLSGLYTPWQIQGDVTIQKLVDFFANPCKWFLKQRFDLNLDKDNTVTGDDELWNLDALDKYSVNNLLMAMRNNNADDAEIYLHANKGNLLPPGRSGKLVFDNIANNLSELPVFWQNAFRTMDRLPAVYRSSKNYTVSGMVNITADQRYVLVYNWSKYKSKQALQALLGALTFSAAAAAENRSTAVGAKILNLDSKNGFEFRTIEPIETADAIELLDEIIALAGEKHDGPLPLFENSSVYYRDLTTAKNKFMKDSYSDVNQPGVSYFFTPAMWDDEKFASEFNYYAAKLYHLIELDEEANAHDNGE